jgi:hypothetical protein
MITFRLTVSSVHHPAHLATCPRWAIIDVHFSDSTRDALPGHALADPVHLHRAHVLLFRGRVRTFPIADVDVLRGGPGRAGERDGFERLRPRFLTKTPTMLVHADVSENGKLVVIGASGR